MRRRVKGASESLAVQVVTAVAQDARRRRPEAAGHRRGDRLAGARSSCSASTELDAAAIERTLGCVLKYGEDQDVVRAAGLGSLV